MSRFHKVALVAAILGTALAATEGSKRAHAYYLSQIADGMSWIWVSGWLTATYAPILLATWFWRRADRSTSPWLLHLLFLASACALFRLGTAAMLSVVDDPDFDATLGAPEMPALFLFTIAVGGYFAGTIAKRSAARQEKAKVL